MFIIGHLGKGCGQQVFPIGEGNQEFNEQTTQGNNLAHTITNADKQRGSYIIHNVYGGFGEEKCREFRDVSPTIRTPKGGGHLPMVKEDMKIRRLTPTECERLQGFPDGWTEGISDSQRYKCLGNAVTVNVIEAIARQRLRQEYLPL